MKPALTIALLCFSGWLFAQGSTHLDLQANLNLDTRGLNSRSEGLGFRLTGSFFTNRKLEWKTTASYQQFVGKRMPDESVRPGSYRRPAIAAMEAGPAWQFSNKLSVTALGGVAQYRLFSIWKKAALLAASIDGAFGPDQHFLIGLQYTTLPWSESEIRFWSLKLGYRLL